MRTSIPAVLMWAALSATAAWAFDPSEGKATAADANLFRFERQLRVNPFDPSALNNLAVVKSQQGRYDDALVLLQRATRLAPESSEIAANLARLRAWMEAVRQAPESPTDPGAMPVETRPELDLANAPPDPPELWDP